MATVFEPRAYHFALRGERVRSFAGLGNEQAQRVAIGNGIAIAVFAGVVDVDRKTRQPLDHVLAGECSMPAGTAGGNVDAGCCGQLLVVDFHLAQVDLARVERDATQRGVANGPRLLPDFLEHEMLVAALFRLNRIP